MTSGAAQSNPANYIPVRLSDGAAFYVAQGGGGGGGTPSSTSTLTAQAPSAASVTAVAANGARLWMTLANQGLQGLVYVRLGTGPVSVASGETAIIGPGGVCSPPINWTGAVQFI